VGRCENVQHESELLREDRGREGYGTYRFGTTTGFDDSVNLVQLRASSEGDLTA
jgi:hypothetical protein